MKSRSLIRIAACRQKDLAQNASENNSKNMWRRKLTGPWIIEDFNK